MNPPSSTGTGSAVRLTAVWSEERFTCGFATGRDLTRRAPLHLSLQPLLRRVQTLRRGSYPSSYARQRAFKRRLQLVAEAHEHLDLRRGLLGCAWPGQEPAGRELARQSPMIS
jgi:hypothetical protein